MAKKNENLDRQSDRLKPTYTMSRSELREFQRQTLGKKPTGKAPGAADFEPAPDPKEPTT